MDFPGRYVSVQEGRSFFRSLGGAIKCISFFLPLVGEDVPFDDRIIEHIYFIFRFVLKSRLRFPGGVTKITRYMCLLQQMVPVYVVVHSGPS